MLKLTICGQSIAGEYSPAASDSIDYLRAYFSFSPDWNGLVKTAQFSQNGTVYSVLVENDCCAVPNELCDGKAIISVFGQEAGKPKRITTLPFEMTIRKSGFSPDSQSPVPPTPDLYSQFVAKIEETTAAFSLPLSRGTGENSLAGGNSLPEKVTGIGSFAYGTDDNQVSGNFAYAFGRHNIISSNNSFASGSWNTVVSNYGFAVGEGNYIGAERGTALGDHCIVNQTHGQFVCGKYNSPTSGVYIIGIGENDTQRRNAVVVKENGDVAISGKVTAAAPTESNQLVTKKYVDDNIPTAVSQLENDAGYIAQENGVTNISSSAVYINAGSVTVSAGSYGVTIEGAPEYNSFVNIHDLAEPEADTDAATKRYVDSRYVSMTQNEYSALFAKNPDVFYFVEAD